MSFSAGNNTALGPAEVKSDIQWSCGGLLEALAGEEIPFVITFS